LPGERNDARNNVRCMQARKTTHGLDGQHQDVEESIRMTEDRDRWKGKRKGKLSIYIAPYSTSTVVLSKRSGMDHTVLPANYTMPALPSYTSTRWRNP